MNNKKYDIFISWHDDQKDNSLPYSKAVAYEYKNFIELVFNGAINVFCSAVDIIGNWRKNLEEQLRDCDYAIFVITDNAIESGWLHAEYGAFMMKAIMKNTNPDYTTLFPICELKNNNIEIQFKGPIKDLQIFYPVCENDSIKEITYKTKFKELLLSIPINHPNFNSLFESNFDIFRKRIKYCKDSGTASYGYLNQLLGYQYQQTQEPQKTPEQQIVNNVESLNITTQEKELNSLLYFRSQTDIVEREDVIGKIKERLNNHAVVNVIGMGGCGKTTITYSFYNNYKNNFNQITGVVINNDFYEDFNKKFTNDLGAVLSKIDIVINNEKIKFEKLDQIWKFQVIVQILKLYNTKGEMFNLLIVDVNENCKYDTVENALKILRKELNNKWRILVVSRELVNPNETVTVNLYTLKQIDGEILKKIFSHYLKDKDKFYQFSDDEYKALFDKIGYLPLLVEQLAYFLVEATKIYSFDSIMKQLGDKVLHSHFADEKLIKSEIYEKDYEIIGDFLSRLMSFKDRLSPNQKNIAKFFMMWPAEYYSTDLIEKMTGYENLDKTLNRLAVKCVLDKKLNSNGYETFKMHGLIAQSFRDQVFTKEENKEYRDFKSYLSNIDINNKILKECYSFSLANFASFNEKYLLEKARQYSESSIYETAFKILFVKLMHKNISNVDIYKIIVGIKDDNNIPESKKNETADQLYYTWLDSLPNTQLVPVQTDTDGNIIISIEDETITMIKVLDEENNIYYIAQTLVTQSLWKTIMDYNPSDISIGIEDNYPVNNVCWYECLEFIIKLTQKTGLKFCFPTEKQWLFAAQGGKDNKNTYCGSNNIDEVAWYDDNSEEQMHPVASKLANELKIYDMTGLVREWLQDSEFNYRKLGQLTRVLRGGAWNFSAEECQITNRWSIVPTLLRNNIGLRLAIQT